MEEPIIGGFCRCAVTIRVAVPASTVELGQRMSVLEVDRVYVRPPYVRRQSMVIPVWIPDWNTTQDGASKRPPYAAMLSFFKVELTRKSGHEHSSVQ